VRRGFFSLSVTSGDPRTSFWYTGNPKGLRMDHRTLFPSMKEAADARQTQCVSPCQIEPGWSTFLRSMAVGKKKIKIFKFLLPVPMS